MRKVIMIGEEPKGVEFTHRLDVHKGWRETTVKPSECSKLVYLGKCSTDGDMFAVTDSFINIYKGNLNNGTY